MDGPVKQALERDRTIDITTRGRQTGQPRRKEIWFHNIEGRLFITGTPGRRDWYANLLANPQIAAAFDTFKQEWAGKLRGRIILLSAVRPESPREEALFSRLT